jgi:sigma-54 specific flagellar transcriptional regulator A
MADRPEIEQPSSDKDHPLVPSFSDLVVLVPARGDNRLLLIEQIPPWVAQWAGKTPREVEGQPITSVSGEVMDALSSVADDVFGDGAPIEDYCVEFTDASGRSRAVRISAQRVDDYRLLPASQARDRADESGRAVLIRLQEITESVRLRRRALGVGAFHGIVGRSQPMLEVFYKIEVYGPTEAPVVISGETGTGKELVARALHERSGRRDKPFVAVNCTALSEELFESELFGHERGAFTGAVRSHKGRFERADKGTLFLDEIGDMPVPIQSKLLRVLEHGMFERVGAEHEQRVDVRILAATNMSLERAVAAQRFRADLYHRLVVLRIHVPPLRERPGDLPLLVEYYLNILNQRYGRRGVRLTPDATRLLGEYYWPGNVRELRNVLERVYVETPGQVIGRNAFNEWIRERDYLSAGGWNLEHLEVQRASAPVIIPPTRSGMAGSGRQVPSLPSPAGTPFPLALPQEPFLPAGRAIDAVYSVTHPPSRKPRSLTADDIRRALAEAGGNATQAARSLGVHKATLYRHMKALGLKREDLEGPPRDGEPRP